MEFDGLIEGRNTGSDFQNIVVKNEKKEIVNLKINKEQIEDLLINNLYHFVVEEQIVKERNQLKLVKYELVIDYYKKWKDLYQVLEFFYKTPPVSIFDMEKTIKNALKKISDDDISLITKKIYAEYEDSFLTFPAAIKFHHAYVGGLAYHTYQMLTAAEAFIKIYHFLDSDLVYAGIILHDLAKVLEFDSPVNTKRTIKGDMLGHLVMGANLIDEMARKHKISNEKVTLLKHIVLSHHGQLEFGSPKRPMLGEAVLISYLDDLDAKMTTIGENLTRIEKGKYTSNIAVMDGMRMYKHK